VAAQDFTYAINNGTITITGYVGPGGNVTIPSTINGLPVTSIGETAFNVITNLTSVTIPNRVTNIGDYAFWSCNSLTNVIIPNVISIGQDAFFDCGLSSVTLPNSVTSVGYEAFDGCSSLTRITIPYSVTNIGYSAFAFCTSLTNIIVDPLNSAYSSVDGVLFNHGQTTLVEYPSGKVESYTIPNSVTNIGEKAFLACNALTSVTIPNSVRFIGAFAFSTCYSLTNVIIPNSVINIGDDAFGGCTRLSNVTIGYSVTNIGDFAFEFSYSLTNVIIPNSVINIGKDAFGFCNSLTGVYFQGNAPTVDSTAFNSDNATAYYLPGTTGWRPTLGGIPTAPWILPSPYPLSDLGIHNNQFGFTVSWAMNVSVVVEASTNPANRIWQPLQTNNLASGSFYFSDPQWKNYPNRFYRVRWP